MTERVRRPAFQFYPADWQKDVELQSCSIAARGLWLEMMCVMHQGVPYGHLIANGIAMTDPQAARLCGVDTREYRKLLAELDRAGVPSRTAEGVIYSRRMVRDEATRNRRAAGGQAGAAFGHLGAEHGAKGGRPRHETGDQTGDIKPPLKPAPSSSSSSSASASSSIENRDVDVSPPSTPTANGSATGNGAIRQTVRQQRNSAKGMDWGDPIWVANTAKTVDVPRRPNEPDDDWKDRIFVAVDQRMKASRTDWNRRKANQ